MFMNKRQGANLPHWSLDGSIYAVCFRLFDSLPTHVLGTWKFERDDIEKMAKQQNRELTD